MLTVPLSQMVTEIFLLLMLKITHFETVCKLKTKNSELIPFAGTLRCDFVQFSAQCSVLVDLLIFQ